MLFRKLPCSLVANDQLVASNAEPGHWQSVGADPHFLLQPRKKQRLRGWVRIQTDLQLPGQCRGRAPFLYVDYGDGMSEATKIALDFSEEAGHCQAMVYLDGPATALRFDPMDEAGEFRLSHLSLQPSSTVGACLWAFRRSIRRNGWQVALQGARVVAAAFFEQVLRLRQRDAVQSVASLARSALALPAAANYEEWIRLHEFREDVPARLRRLPARPLISVVMPVYNTPEAWLREAIESVLVQSYREWELCICDDNSSEPHVARVLAEYAAREPRIRVHRRAENGHIVHASNDAIALARGEWTAFLDHDDCLHVDALLALAEAAQSHPEPGLIYSDEDKLDPRGRRAEPYFKPDFDPELLLGQNFVCHLMAVRTALLRELGGLRPGFEGAQDHDLVLRLSERLTPQQVVHVPRVLYHWRVHAASTAGNVQAKNYARDAGLAAVADHLQRCGVQARVEGLDSGHIRVHRTRPEPAPRVSILIPTRDRVELLATCIDSLQARTDYPNVEVIVIDNGSVEPATLDFLQHLRGMPGYTVIRDDGPFNFSRLNNLAAALAQGEVLVMMNNDIEAIEPQWLDAMVAQAMRPEIGAVGALLLYPDDTIQHGGVVLGIGGVAGHVHHRLPADAHGYFGRARLAQRFSAVTAACLAVRRSCWDAVQGLDEGLAVAFNDIDFCLRLQRAGYRNLWTPLARLYHHESASRGSDEVPEKRERFNREIAYMQNRWGDSLLADPCYNPNLSLNSQRFELAYPPRVRSATQAHVEAA